MKSRICPYRQHCCDSGGCETCDFGKAFENLSKKIKKLKAKNEALQAENEELKTKIDILENPNF
ncbi:MAG: hypothetical protein IJ489_10280 [Clostridia bacterium]|nr:hypothetical protein [Clostridia bacterium]